MKKISLNIPQNRIWELDFLKGIAFVFMVWDHAVFDLYDFFGVDTSALGIFQEGIGYVAAALFMLICGISITLGSHNVKHGLITFGLGMALTLGTWLGGEIVDMQIIIAFGILHFLGLSMIIGHFAKKLPNFILILLTACSAAIGIWFSKITVSVPFLFPFGLCKENFFSSDYFPLFPNLAFTFFGIFIGKVVYSKKKSVIPKPKKLQKSLLCLFGRHTLFLYFAHQPIVVGVIFIIAKIFKL